MNKLQFGCGLPTLVPDSRLKTGSCLPAGTWTRQSSVGSWSWLKLCITLNKWVTELKKIKRFVKLFIYIRKNEEVAEIMCRYLVFYWWWLNFKMDVWKYLNFASAYFFVTPRSLKTCHLDTNKANKSNVRIVTRTHFWGPSIKMLSCRWPECVTLRH